MRSKEFLLLAGLAAAFLAPAATAWGPAGHRIVGTAAHAMLDPKARQEVDRILAFGGQGHTVEALDNACNWPDEVRETTEWEWSSPLHYVNIPRSTAHYSAQRDCREGLCVTAAITRYANELAQPQLSLERRWQALAFICHFVGDVHQPLHAGFRDDRGGNQVDIEYGGQEWNLHHFWDSVVAAEKLESEPGMVADIVKNGRPELANSWSPLEAADWTEQSHALAVEAAYPEDKEISPEFAEQAWQIIQAQWLNASLRLALVLNAVLGEGKIVAGD